MIVNYCKYDCKLLLTIVHNTGYYCSYYQHSNNSQNGMSVFKKIMAIIRNPFNNCPHLTSQDEVTTGESSLSLSLETLT